MTVGSVLPISTGKWWYPTAYAIFLVFYPFYQQGLQSLQEVELKKLIIVMACLWTLPTIVPMKLQLGADNTTCFFMLYALIFYVRKFSPRWATNPKVYKWMTIGGYAIAFLSIIVLDMIGTRIKSVNDYACYYIRGDWRIMPVVISVGLFLWATHWKLGYNKIVNWMGGLTFAVYLIHMHPQMINLLFKKAFILGPYVNTPKIVPYTIGVTLLVFAACALVDQCRKWLYSSIEWIWSLRRK